MSDLEPDSSSESSLMHLLHPQSAGICILVVGRLWGEKSLQTAAFAFWSLAGFTALASFHENSEDYSVPLHLKKLLPLPSWFCVLEATWPKNKRNEYFLHVSEESAHFHLVAILKNSELLLWNMVDKILRFRVVAQPTSQRLSPFLRGSGLSVSECCPTSGILPC